MNKTVIFSSLACGIAAGIATWFLYDPVAERIKKLRKKPETEPIEEINPIDEAPDPAEVAEYEQMASAYSTATVDYTKDQRAESPSEDLLIYPIDLDKFMAWGEDERHVCTWYRKDKVLAGMDDDLEMLDLYETFGTYGSRLIEECESSGLYLLRADDGQAFEVVISDDDYDTDYAEYQVIRDSMVPLQKE